MEITYEEAESMLQKRLNEYPEIQAIVSDPKTKTTLAELIAFNTIDASLLPEIEYELHIVLARYAPLSDLSANIVESTGLPLETTEGLVTMIETIILGDIYADLYAFDLFWKNELEKAKSLPEVSKDTREKLELRPEGVPVRSGGIDNPKPLTREEVLQTLSLKRTMETDIASLAHTGSAPAVNGYEAYRRLNSEEKDT